MYHKPFIIAEVGCNHMGQMEIAHELIEVAAHFCKADAIKFQKRCPKELLTDEQYNAPHPNPANSYGRTYGEHREFLEFTLEQHSQLKEWCEQAGIIYSTSVWDMICDNYKGEIQLSFGMTTHEEEERIVQLFEKNGRADDLVLFNCTSGYPVPFQDICLLEIKRMRQKYENRVKAIGFSGHHLGIAVDVAAYTLGASVIERHYTLDRTWKGTDHAASLEPDGIRRLIRDLNVVHNALTYKSSEILPIEQIQRDKLKYRSK